MMDKPTVDFVIRDRGLADYNTVKYAIEQTIEYCHIYYSGQQSENKQEMIKILKERFLGDYEKYSDFDNISLVVDVLKGKHVH